MRKIIWLLLFSISVEAQVYIKLVADLEVSNINTEIDIASIILKHIEDHKLSELTFSRLEENRKAQWRLIQSQPDICLYNKIKHKSRLKNALFTDIPLTAFPSNRLITYKTKHIKGNVSLYEMVNLYGLKVGVIESRSYGKKLDEKIDNLKSKLIIISGEDSSQRLRKMFLQKKIDAIIEYESVFSYENRNEIAFTDFNFHTIDNTDNFVFGYIACSKSEQGKKAISNFNKILNNKAFEQKIIKLHKQLFLGKEQGRAIRSLSNIFQHINK